jgi:hypothetical protein
MLGHGPGCDCRPAEVEERVNALEVVERGRSGPSPLSRGIPTSSQVVVSLTKRRKLGLLPVADLPVTQTAQRGGLCSRDIAQVALLEVCHRTQQDLFAHMPVEPACKQDEVCRLSTGHGGLRTPLIELDSSSPPALQPWSATCPGLARSAPEMAPPTKALAASGDALPPPPATPSPGCGRAAAAPCLGGPGTCMCDEWSE